MNCCLMPDSTNISRQNATVPFGDAAGAVLLQPLLAQVAGDGSFPVSLALDFSAALIEGQSVSVEAWIDRATRSLIFAHGRVLSVSGELIVSGSAIFRRAATHSLTPDSQS